MPFINYYCWILKSFGCKKKTVLFKGKSMLSEAIKFFQNFCNTLKVRFGSYKQKQKHYKQGILERNLIMRLNYSLTTLRQCAHFCCGDCSSNNIEEWNSFYRKKIKIWLNIDSKSQIFQYQTHVCVLDSQA